MGKAAYISLPVVADDRVRAIGQTLEAIRKSCDVQARVREDPVGIVRRFHSFHDRELVGLLASSLAFGNVKTIRSKVEDVLRRLGGEPALAAGDERHVRRSLDGFVHRVFRGEDVASLLVGARRIQLEEGSLGARFRAELDLSGTLRPALVAWSRAVRSRGGLDRPSARRGPSHLLPDPSATSACKRLLLYLRWMVRPDDGIDLGLWPVPSAILICPVDTHIHKLSRNLGFTSSKTVTWKAAEEITRWLALFDSEDPVKYDFSLCHMGMLQRCPSQRDATRCDGCPIQRTCRHWATPRKRTARKS